MSLILAAAASAAPLWYREGAFLPPATVLEMVHSCGVDGAQVEYSGDLQENFVRLPAGAEIDDDQLTCLARTAFETGYFFEMPEEYLATYYARSEVIAEPWNLELARQHLEELGKLDALPVKDADETDEAFAHRIEAFCDAEGALSSDYGPHTISPDWGNSEAATDFQRIGTMLTCLSSAATIAGFPIGMIGNEKASEAGH